MTRDPATPARNGRGPRRQGLAAIAAFGALAALGLTAPARAAPAAEDMKAVQAAALKEGVVSFYHNLRPQGVEQLMSEFRKAHPGIKTEQIAAVLGYCPYEEVVHRDNLAVISRGDTGPENGGGPTRNPDAPTT